MNHRNHRLMLQAIVSAAIVVGFVISSTAAVAAGPARVVDHFFTAYRAGDVEAMATIYAEDVQFTDVCQRHEINGRAAMRENLGNLSTIHKRMDVEVKRRAITGNLVTVEVLYTGTLDGTAIGQADQGDLEYSLPAVLLFEVEDGHILKQTDYLDFRTFSEKFAALLPPAATH